MNCWPGRPASAQSIYLFLSGALTTTGLRPLFTISISDSCRKSHGVSAASSVRPDLSAALREKEQALQGSRIECESYRQELDDVERQLAALLKPDGDGAAESIELSGLTLLYVGGRAHQIPQLKAMTERAGGRFLHHDGGIEHASGLIPGLISRADRVLFPIDCISHDAVATIKRQCRLTGKVYEPLRTAGLACLLSALARMTGCRKTIAAE